MKAIVTKGMQIGELLENSASVLNQKYYVLPYWFEKTENGNFIMHFNNELPKEITENVVTLEESINLLQGLKEDAKMALDGSWDCTTQEGINTGFGAQIILINNLLDKL
jgi:outer membrane translocation and assembly module TamA